nr:MAG TPA: hypothetical protein [Microviridae sp.]
MGNSADSTTEKNGCINSTLITKVSVSPYISSGIRADLF